MGAYYYVTSPSLTAKARVRFPDGREDVIPVALYRYAYKPYGAIWRDSGDAARNHRMHVQSGALACEAAYTRSGADVPAWGISFDADSKTVYPLHGDGATRHPFKTKGKAGGLDDYDFCNQDGAPLILEYVELPKGLKLKRADGGCCSVGSLTSAEGGGFAGFPGRDSSAWQITKAMPFPVGPETSAQIIRRKLCAEYAAVLADLTTEATVVRAVFTDDSVLYVTRGAVDFEGASA